MSEQWTGKNDEKSVAYALAYAQLGMEHTEAMRRARIPALLPYMYAGWTKTRTGQEWKAGFAKPVSACGIALYLRYWQVLTYLIPITLHLRK